MSSDDDDRCVAGKYLPSESNECVDIPNCFLPTYYFDLAQEKCVSDVVEFGIDVFETAAELKVVFLGDTQHICQITGPGKTDQYNVYGTDLGVSFQHGESPTNDGTLYIMFGDTWETGKGFNGAIWDSIAKVTDSNPDDCLQFNSTSFIQNGRGPFSDFSQGLFEVPSGAMSYWNKIYGFFTESENNMVMMKSILAVSDNDGLSFYKKYEFSNLGTTYRNKFMYSYPYYGHGDYIQELPKKDLMLVWGAGVYRQSAMYFGYVEFDKIGNRDNFKYFKGLNSSGDPTWTTNGHQNEAAPVIDANCIGEFSVAWIGGGFDKWVALYNCGNPRGIIMSTADKPWGPWTDGRVIFDPDTNNGYGYFMHKRVCIDWADFDKQDPPCVLEDDGLADPGRKRSEWGGEYAPSIIKKFTKLNMNSNGSGTAIIYYLMSSWNPYQVHLMKTVLTKVETN